MADITQSQDDELEDDLEQGSKTVERIGLLAGPALAAAAYFSGPAMGLTADATAVFALLALMATWWVTMAVEPAVTGLVPFVALALLGIGKPAEIAAPYANDVMFLFGGGALLAFGLEKTRVSSRFATALVGFAGSSPLRVLTAVMLASALISAFVSNLATAATMLPLAIALGNRARAAITSEDQRAAAGRFATSLLLGVAFASSIGGALTIVGSPPNPIAVEWLTKNGVFLLAVLAWVTLPLYGKSMPAVKDGTIAIACAGLLFLIPSVARAGRGILDGAALSKVPWRVLVLFGGGLCLADAMQRSGLSTALGTIIQSAGTLPSIGVLIVLVAMLVFASEVASITTLAAMAVPIVGALAPGLGVAPETLVIPAVFAASWAFALPVGTPPNALVFASGRVRTRDMMRAGLVLDLVAIVVIVVMSRILL